MTDLVTLQRIAATELAEFCSGIQLTPDVLDDILGRVIAELMLAPQARRVADDRSEADLTMRLR
jgi:hypothetical protein